MLNVEIGETLNCRTVPYRTVAYRLYPICLWSVAVGAAVYTRHALTHGCTHAHAWVRFAKGGTEPTGSIHTMIRADSVITSMCIRTVYGLQQDVSPADLPPFRCTYTANKEVYVRIYNTALCIMYYMVIVAWPTYLWFVVCFCFGEGYEGIRISAAKYTMNIISMISHQTSKHARTAQQLRGAHTFRIKRKRRIGIQARSCGYSTRDGCFIHRVFGRVRHNGTASSVCTGTIIITW